MNADRLLAHYERIADAPDAIARLRRFILDLAVRGKLVPQEAKDEPASELLKRIAKAKVERKKKTGDARIKTEPDPSPDELDMHLPSGWAVQSFENLFLFIDYRGNTPPKTDDGIPLITAKNIRMGYLNREPREYISKSTFKTWMTRGFPEIGDLFFTTEAPLANICLNDIEEPFALAQRAICFQPYATVDTKFLMFALMSDVMQSLIDKHATGMTAKGIKAANLKPLPIPLPPLAEQHRIVAKVDELMGLCDRLEAARASREAVRDRLAAASLARLNAPDPETFHDDARFALDALPALTTRPDQIKRLRQTILNLAVRGKLVPPDPNDEPASDLLKDISKMRKKLYAERRIPKPKELPAIDEVDLPFPMPLGWAWSMLGDLCYQVSDGPHFSPQYVSAEVGVPFLSARNIRLGSFDLSTVKHVSRADHEEFCKRIRPEKGDIIYTKGGTTGIAKVNDLDFEFSVWVHLAVLRIEKERLYPRYVELALNSPHCYAQSQHYTQGTSNFDLGLTRMIKITIPLPPLAEQHRIVAKVDALMALCDRLEASLTATAATRRRLLDALLAEALAPVDAREMEAAE